MKKNESDFTILIVDDTPANIDFIKGILSDAYLLQVAINGKQALKIIDRKKPDLILLDIMMPDMDGYEVCKQLKDNEETRNIPVIFISALTTIEEQIKGFEVGADDYLPKPVNPDLLKAKVILAIDSIENNKNQAEALNSATSAAMTALVSLSELGTAMMYLQSLPLMNSYMDIANKILEFIKYFNLTAIVRIEPEPGEFYFSSTKGSINELDKSVLEKLQNSGNTFNLKDRSFFKNEYISLLVIKMPVHNEELYGRLKDHFSMVINGTITAIESVRSKQKITLLMESKQEENDKLNNLIQTIESVLLMIEQTQMDLQNKSVHNMNELVHGIEDLFIYLGLNEKQEHDLLSLINKSDERAQQLFDKNVDLEMKITQLRKQINN